MTLKRVFDNLFSAYDRTSFQVGKSIDFFLDFFYFNAELVSFFIINIIYFLYIFYHWLMPLRIELELVDRNRLILDYLIGKEQNSEELKNQLKDADKNKVGEMLNTLLQKQNIQNLDEIFKKDDQLEEIKKIYTKWQERNVFQYLGIAAGILLMYFIFLTYVWYYTYLSHNNTFLFIVMTLNLLLLLVIGDPYSNTHKEILPVLYSLKNTEVPIIRLKIGKDLLVSTNAKSNEIQEIMKKLSSELLTPEERKRLINNFEDALKNLLPSVEKTTAINNLIYSLEARPFFNTIIIISIINYIYRVYMLINGLSPKLTLATKLSI